MFNRAFRFALAAMPRVFFPVVVLVVFLAGTAHGGPPTVTMVPAPPGPTDRVGDYTCAGDVCVFDPDPAGDPVPVEADSGLIPRGFLPDGTDVRVSMRPVGWSSTPPPDASELPAYGADGGPSEVTPDADDQHDPAEDSPSFDCRRHGNGVCGPGNSQGVAAGCYVRSGQRAGTLIRPWDVAMATDPHYRPDGCGTRTAKDRAVDDAWANGRDGQLCAAVADGPGVVCWFVGDKRPTVADGPAWVPPAP